MQRRLSCGKRLQYGDRGRRINLIRVIRMPQLNFFDVKEKKEKEKFVVTFDNGKTQGYNLNNMRKIDKAYLDDSGLTTTLTVKDIQGTQRRCS